MKQVFDCLPPEVQAMTGRAFQIVNLQNSIRDVRERMQTAKQCCDYKTADECGQHIQLMRNEIAELEKENRNAGVR